MGAADTGLIYYRINMGGGWTDNITAALNQNGNNVTVSLGATTDIFTVSGTSYTPSQGNGATLSLSGSLYTYRTSDGTVVRFDKVRANGTPYYANAGRVIDVTQPNGLKLTYGYDSIKYCGTSKPSSNGSICLSYLYAYRINTVTSSSGYNLGIRYGEIDDYDLTDAFSQPDFVTYSTPLGVTGSNKVIGGLSLTESFVTSGSTYNITDPAGRTTSYGPGTITAPGSASPDTTIAYAGTRVSSISAANGTTAYGSSDAGGLRTVTTTIAAAPQPTTYVFEIATSLLRSITNALGQKTQYDYDGSGRVIKVTAPDQNYAQYSYDVRGNVTAVTVGPKAGTSRSLSSAGYTATCANLVTCNHPAWTRDANNKQTDYAYDPATGNPTVVTAPAPVAGAIRPQTRYSYASQSGVSLLSGVSRCRTTASCVGTADEVKTSIAYNANLLPTRVTSGAGNASLTASTAVSYDAVGNVVSVDGPLPGTVDTTNYSWNADRELTAKISPDPDGSGPLKRRAQTLIYLPTGQVGAVTVGTTDAAGGSFSALQQVVSEYDSLHRQVKSTVKSGSTIYEVTQYSYDSLGRVQCTAQRMNPASWNAQPNACVAATAGSAGPDRIARVDYDELGRVKA